MKNLLNITAAAMLMLASQSSFAQSSQTRTSQDSSSYSQLLSETTKLKEIFNKFMMDSDAQNPTWGNARAYSRIEEIEMEAASISDLSSRTAVSMHGRTMSEIQREVKNISEAYGSVQGTR